MLSTTAAPRDPVLERLARWLQRERSHALYLVDVPPGMEVNVLEDRVEQLLEPASHMVRVRYPVDAEGPIRTLLQEVPAVCRATDRHPELTSDDHWVLFISGLDDLLSPENPRLFSALRDINGLRDTLLTLRSPTVFWAHGDTLERLARDAPDFWNWASVMSVPAAVVPLARSSRSRDPESGVVQASRVVPGKARQPLPAPGSLPWCGAQLEQLRPRLLLQARQLGLTLDDAEDVVQEVVLQLLARVNRGGNLQAGGGVSADRFRWLAVTLVGFECKKMPRAAQFRRSSFSEIIPACDAKSGPVWQQADLVADPDDDRVMWEGWPEVADPAPGPEAVLLDREIKQEVNQRVNAVINSLSPFEQALFRARYVDDMSLADIGAALGLSLSTVRTRLYRSLARLRRVAAAVG